MTSDRAIRVSGLRKSYGGHEAVRGIDFEVRTGEVFGLLGPNGAGKTTTVEILDGRTRCEPPLDLERRAGRRRDQLCGLPRAHERAREHDDRRLRQAREPRGELGGLPPTLPGQLALLVRLTRRRLRVSTQIDAHGGRG